MYIFILKYHFLKLKKKELDVELYTINILADYNS